MDVEYLPLGPMHFEGKIHGGQLFHYGVGVKVLVAFLNTTYEPRRWRSSEFHMLNFNRKDTQVHLSVSVSIEVASATLGLLLAICTGNPEDMPAGWKAPLTVTLHMYGVPTGVRGRADAVCLIAPLRELAKSVVVIFRGRFEAINLEAHLAGFGRSPSVRGTEGNYPLGHLRVELVP